MGKDYYKLLNLKRTASLEEIKSAYRKLALVYHPDRSVASNLTKHEAEGKFQYITEAYEVLTDQHRRKEYDESNGINDSLVREAINQHRQWNPQPVYYRKFRIVRPGRYHNYENDVDHRKFDVKTWKMAHYGENIDKIDEDNMRKVDSRYQCHIQKDNPPDKKLQNANQSTGRSSEEPESSNNEFLKNNDDRHDNTVNKKKNEDDCTVS